MPDFLPSEPAETRCRILMETLEKEGCIDFSMPSDKRDARLATAVLFSEGRGQMFGILVCEQNDSYHQSNAEPGTGEIVLKAFSGQFNGVWEAAGWVPPIPSPAEFQAAVEKADPEIKRLTAEIEKLRADLRGENSAKLTKLMERRRLLSQSHMAEIHGLYTVRNFSGRTASLFDIFDIPDDKPWSIPAGTGDCCAPKLLNFAAANGLKPLSLAEFFWGRENRSGTKLHGMFYPPCTDKCVPLLGFMLEGLSPRMTSGRAGN